MRVLLIDADSTIPNLALMKLSACFKQRKHKVDLLKLNIPYYPNRKRKMCHVDTEGYDEVYCSVVFDGAAEYVDENNITFGGTGYSLKTALDAEIEAMAPDYSIYPGTDTSYGFISRGCIRNCKFCKVPEKEGHIRQVASIGDIARHKKVKFMDNNILALPNHKNILGELRDKNIKCQFNQGLDIRLVDKENSKLLSQLNYMEEYTFALDDIKYLPMVERKLSLLVWRKAWRMRFFVYVEPKMKLSNVVRRVEFLRKRKLLPYIMRNISCWGSSLSSFYVDLAAWCNQPGLLKKMSFYTFMGKRYIQNGPISRKNKKRVKQNREYYYENR